MSQMLSDEGFKGRTASSPGKKKGAFREYGEALLTALLVAFLIRSFVIEAFKIPSGSMIPTLMIGDHIFVNKFIYGLRIPFTKKRLVNLGVPQRGDAIVFIYPVDESKDFIKRVIGLPGDHIKITGDMLVINGQEAAREPIPSFSGGGDYQYFMEDLGTKKHLVQFDDRPSYDAFEFEVPPSSLFVMGDNRDNSADSREWGFVPMENVKGKAMFVWLSIDYDRKTLRWSRFGRWIE